MRDEIHDLSHAGSSDDEHLLFNAFLIRSAMIPSGSYILASHDRASRRVKGKAVLKSLEQETCGSLDSMRIRTSNFALPD
ncbi:hypothetical protein Pmar_PMAR000482 [Perkinsus marinus ATCC 50983]|uniref:Uncharacterized protein n=1 Tax=Perkinsus marinus (strain ATCC 50983 / TXsc) TaxID=423536 RepID=C5LEH1_PERM5|nr:hypothetical protein Pmar_PMAR000482 [Perkinsus marinus ATCC 50983]EER04872.1 hypothetical protein Pmar_PMAR000482 [Perkinsus marinus ATCC 50983]|eukprot:XP_002773056.1 hypothetical protein Pmar_PMAR000482 [Perkinsus marinus ATCC 50983]